MFAVFLTNLFNTHVFICVSYKLADADFISPHAIEVVARIVREALASLVITGRMSCED